MLLHAFLSLIDFLVDIHEMNIDFPFLGFCLDSKGMTKIFWMWNLICFVSYNFGHLMRTMHIGYIL